jgi:hypothetical protein
MRKAGIQGSSVLEVGNELMGRMDEALYESRILPMFGRMREE